MWRVIGIDVGYSHLAAVVCDVDKDDYKINVVFSKMTDLRRYSCKDSNCMFEKWDRKAGHLVHHYVEDMSGWFSTADQIVIEAQPIMSTHKDVEQLLLVYIKQRFSVPLNKPKNHVKLIAPQSMHYHFNMASSKEDRRREIVGITHEYLSEQQEFKNADQKDHLADAMGFIIYYVKVLMPSVMIKMKPNPFERFKFDPEDQKTTPKQGSFC